MSPPSPVLKERAGMLKKSRLVNPNVSVVVAVMSVPTVFIQTLAKLLHSDP